ncbi:(2E,6E)-farnesyl diphosphate synthase [Actinomadura rubteroloni]|uniref:(2E,6E)-farnesyl diphosphate synthase n=1 Tax=Actinomadura rubteroloni TaxID=1926885 RepID=A0A2P4UE26_9ACTN|nr:polyprenyl synthetase family protein [Actinomadura rubteroloni]POM23313.1 (2E,6E)-farnesyl diphosphate synthase [Actinomadura rubteroloni]
MAGGKTSGPELDTIIASLPRFHRADRPATNPHAAYAEQQVQQWARHWKVVGPEPEFFHRIQYGHCAALTYPNASPETLALCAQWIAWGFIIDDQHTRVLKPTASQWTAMMGRFEAVFAGTMSPGTGDGGAFEAATDDLCRRTRAALTPGQWERFVDGVWLFLEGMRSESEFQSAARPSMGEYVEIRRKTIGVSFYAVLVELEEGVELPARVHGTEVYREILETISWVFALINDIVSYPAENAAGEINNFIVIAEKSYRLPTEAALRRAHADLVRSMDRFEELRRDMPQVLEKARVPSGDREAAARCVVGMTHFIDGILAWYPETYRYSHQLECTDGQALEDENLLDGAGREDVANVPAGGSPGPSAAPAAEPAVGTARTAARILAEASASVEPALRAAIDELPGPLRLIAGYHAGWWDAEGRPCDAVGKRIRSALALTCAAATSSTPVARMVSDPAASVFPAALSAGVAVELVHDFSLLHDDVIDGDRMRRHHATAWVSFGTGNAIVTGDALLITAVRQLDSGQAIKVLSQAVADLCEGELADLTFETRADPTVPECMATAEAKTGALLGAACQLGALAAGAPGAVADAYRRFGRCLGLAFQLTDDLLGIAGDPQVTGKPVGADLVARKKSLPVVAALTSGTPAGSLLTRLYDRPDRLEGPELARAVALVEEAGGMRWARQEAGRQMEAAFQALRPVDPEPSAAEDLRTLAEMITSRDR